MPTVRATYSGHLGMPGGQSVAVSEGDEYDASDPVVAQHRALFKPAEPAAPAKKTTPPKRK